MTPHVAVVGPARPAEFATLLAHAGAQLAGVEGLGGGPVNALVRALLDAGCTVDLVTLDPSLTRELTVESARLNVFVGPYRRSPRARTADLFLSERRAVASLLARSRAELLHAHWTYEFAWPVVSAQRPHVVTAHDAPLSVLKLMPDPYRAVRALMSARVALGAHTVTAVSPSVAERWAAQMPFRGSVAVVPNVVSPRARHRPKIDDSVILSVGNGTSLKNVRTLLSAFVLVRCRATGARLRLVGPDLEAGGAVHAWARARGLGNGVEFMGSLPHGRLLELMDESSLLCHPSLEESFGMTVAEALSGGLPVVAGDRSGAIPWLLAHGRAGVLTDVRQPERLADAMLSVLFDPSLASRLAGEGPHRVREFAADRVVESYLAVYSDVVARRTRSHSLRGGA